MVPIIVLNLLFTLVFLATIMLFILFYLSANDDKQKNETVVSKAVSDFKTAWVFGGYNTYRAATKKLEVDRSVQQSQLDSQIAQYQNRARVVEKNSIDTNNSLRGQSSMLVTLFIVITFAYIVYGIYNEQFTSTTSTRTLVTIFMFLMLDILFFIMVTRPYQSVNSASIYHTVLNDFLSSETSYNIKNENISENNEQYCRDINL